jgi:hypothetical protein
VFGWPDPNTGFDQSEHALYTCYFIIQNNFISSFLQYDDKYHTGGHHQYVTISQHDQILERTTRDLRHTKASGGACQECAIPQTSTDCRHFLLEMGANQESEENQTLMTLTKVSVCPWRKYSIHTCKYTVHIHTYITQTVFSPVIKWVLVNFPGQQIVINFKTVKWGHLFKVSVSVK